MRAAGDDLEDTTPKGFMQGLGLHLWAEDGRTHGRAALGPHLAAPGSDRPRTGALATMVDVVGGLLPEASIHPTVDLRVQLLRPMPTEGDAHLVCDPIKIGRQLWVGQVSIEDGDGEFARGLITFLHNREPFNAYEFVRPDGEPVADAFDQWFAPHYPDERTVLVDRTPQVSNWGTGTIQGGIQATMVEIAAERALLDHGRAIVDDLEIRYLGASKVGPVAARGEVLSVRDARAIVQVLLTDEGLEARTVAVGTALCRVD